MELNHILLHLSLIEGVGPATVERLFQAVKHAGLQDLAALYQFTCSDLMQYGQLPKSRAQKVKEGLLETEKLYKELELIERYRLRMITLFDKEYPELLKAIYLPPLVLYIQGDSTILQNKSVAFVGARKADRYGYMVLKQLLPELVADGWTIVSGGALGIDSMAHKVTLEYKGTTVAVLGSGLLKPYPAINAELFTHISTQRGAVISPFPLRINPHASNFPARNRIIAGLSRGTVIVQAAAQSGALITARYALEQGREVMAVPGSLENPLSAGCHALIKEGALLVSSAYDMLTALNGVAPAYKEQKPFHTETANPLLSYLTAPLSFDELLVKTGLQQDQLREALSALQLEGHIMQDFMGLWQITS